MANLAIINHKTNDLEHNSKHGKASKLGVNFFERGTLLYIRLTLDGQKREKSLGINIKPGTLQNKTQTISGDSESSALIKAIYSDIYSNASKRRVLEIDLNIEDILNEVLNGKGLLESLYTFETFLLEAYNEAESKYSAGGLVVKSFTRYKRLYDITLGYFQSTFKSTSIRLESITYYHVRQFIENLTINKGFSSETIRKYIQFGARAFELARQQKKQEHNPFKGHKLPRAKNYSHNHLTQDELNSFSSLELNSLAFVEVRDYFLFQCYTGLNYVDLQGLKPTDIKETQRGLAISIKRSKTGTDTFIPLLPVVKDILEKYAEEGASKCFNIPTNQHYNRVLKELSVISGLGKKLTTSFARKTFINLAFDLGIDLDSICIIVGHKAAKMAQKYYLAKQSPNRAFDAMETLKSKL